MRNKWMNIAYWYPIGLNERMKSTVMKYPFAASCHWDVVTCHWDIVTCHCNLVSCHCNLVPCNWDIVACYCGIAARNKVLQLGIEPLLPINQCVYWGCISGCVCAYFKPLKPACNFQSIQQWPTEYVLAWPLMSTRSPLFSHKSVPILSETCMAWSFSLLSLLAQ